MAVTYDPIIYSGPAFADVYALLTLQSKALSRGLANPITGVKNRRIVRKVSGKLNWQPFDCGIPDENGNLSMGDKILNVVLITLYDTYCPVDVIRSTSLIETLSPGVDNYVSAFFEDEITAQFFREFVSEAEKNFWGAISTTTQTAIAAAGNAAKTEAYEKATAAALTPNTYGLDGILAKLILNKDTLSGTPEAVPAITVDGTVLTSANLIAEFEKVYALLSDTMVDNAEQFRWLVPLKVQRLINILNKSRDFRDYFLPIAPGVWDYNGFQVEAVQLPGDNMIVANPMDLLWLGDATGDMETLEIDDMPKPSKERYMRMDFAMGTEVMSPEDKLLYVA